MSTKMEVYKRNKVIAKFTGCEVVETTNTLEPNAYVLVKEDGGTVFFYEDNLPYDKDWNWLMVAVGMMNSTWEEILKNTRRQDLETKEISDIKNVVDQVRSCVTHTNRVDAWKWLVNYANWYNNLY